MGKCLFFCAFVILSSLAQGINGKSLIDLEHFLRELEDELEVIDRNDRTITEVTKDTTFQKFGLQKPQVTIAAFNIQIFGDRKYSKKDVVEILLKILQRYDLILIQEIRDTSGDSFPKLVQDLIDKTGKDWEFAISPRLGRTDSKEEYAYLYRSDLMSLTDVFVYDDSENDTFERQPYCALFHIKDAAVPDVGFIGIHTKPSEAEKEVDGLVEVYDAAAERFNTKNIILMGDFNADCSYIGKGEWPHVRLRTQSRFQWLIGDGIDTTTKASHCAYDRFVVAGDELQNAIQKSSVKIFHYNEEYGLDKRLTKKVSDHYPIQLDIVGKISDDVLKNVQVSHSINVHCDVEVDKTDLKQFSNSLKVANFNLLVSKAGRGIRSVLAERFAVSDVPEALADLQAEYPSLMSDVVIATVESFLETNVLDENPKALGYPAINEDTYDIKILYIGKFLTYDVTISKNVA